MYMSAQCPNLIKNQKICNCTYEPCARKGKCCECIAYHKKFNELPACYFKPDEEKTYDRSISFFIQCNILKVLKQIIITYNLEKGVIYG